MLFQPTVLRHVFPPAHALGLPPGPEPISGGISHNIALQMLVIAAVGLPGYFLAGALMDRLGRKAIQLQGFAAMTLLFLVLGTLTAPLQAVPALMFIL